MQKQCVIIGNGPSIKDLDLDRILLPTFGTNAIYLKYIPTYYVIEDRLVAQDRRVEINALFLPKFAGKHLQAHLNNCIWLKENMDSVYPMPPRFTDGQRFFTGGTVTYLCLQIAFVMGFEEVYLLGVDHNYTQRENAREVGGGIMVSTGEDPDHFDPEYFGAGKRFHDPRPERMLLAYQTANEVYEAAGRKIYNASPESLLEVFERRELPC